MGILYYFFAVLIVVIATTSLLTKRLSLKVLCVQLTVLTIILYLSSSLDSWIGIPVVGVQVVIIFCVIKEYRVENVLLACLGQFINLAVNNAFCYMIVMVSNMSLKAFEEMYWLPFCVVYTIFISAFLYGVKYMLYEKLHLMRLLGKIPATIRYGLTTNVVLYIFIFYVTITMGQQAGYTSQGLLFNCILFGVCMLVSSILIFICIRSVKSEEQKKSERQQQEITEKYIVSLENMLEDMKAFKHDYRNMLSAMSGFIREDNMADLRQYFSDHIQNMETDKSMETKAWKGLRDLQPLEFKGFLYEKILLAMSRNLDITVHIEENMNIIFKDTNTLIRILGAFIDNAIEEAEVTAGHNMSIIARYTEKGIVFMIDNVYTSRPDLSKVTRKGYSTKGQNRGMGLYWVEKLLQNQENLIHTMEIEDGKVIQKIEVLGN